MICLSEAVAGLASVRSSTLSRIPPGRISEEDEMHV